MNETINYNKIEKTFSENVVISEDSGFEIRVSLDSNLHCLFNLNGSLKEIVLIESALEILQNTGTYSISVDLKCYINDDNQFIIEGLDRNLVFSAAQIESSNRDTKTLYMWEQSSGSETYWTISNPLYYWTLTPGDIINIDFPFYL